MDSSKLKMYSIYVLKISFDIQTFYGLAVDELQYFFKNVSQCGSMVNGFKS
jgi:hypothetical protein